MTFTGFLARIDAICHKIWNPKHDLKWRIDADELCDGDIVCKTCGIIFWCRYYDLSYEEQRRREKNLKH